jgi:hypothetical protein
LPEAPASANCHITIEGRQVQLTLRDVDETCLLARLTAVLKQYPPAQPSPQTANQPRREAGPVHEMGWCHKHDVEMTLNHKDGRQWWSHFDDRAGKWCKGR